MSLRVLLSALLLVAAALPPSRCLSSDATTLGNNDIEAAVEALVSSERVRSEVAVEKAWTKYKKFLLSERGAAIRKGDLLLINSVDDELKSPVAHPDDWAEEAFRRECSSYHEACSQAYGSYIAAIDRLIPQQVRQRRLDVANALHELRESYELRSKPKSNAHLSSREVIVDDFDDGGSEMKAFGELRPLEIVRADAPHAPFQRKSKGLRFNWSSPHGNIIEGYYVGKRAPLLDTGKPINIEYRLWLQSGAAPASAEVRFSDSKSEVFVWSQPIQDAARSGWRKVSIPINWSTSDYSFGSNKDGVVDFPVNVQGYAFTFDNQQKPASWLVVDDVRILHTD